MMHLLWATATSASQPAAASGFEQWVVTLLIVLIVMVAWLVLAQHRLARNQVQIAEMLEAALARGKPGARPGDTEQMTL